ncbi:hypothetical protein PGT21_004959 [Puccinia graminis f. sp. tritici]|uniref:Uncharacterized protein n=1 Tax=Puccinia graminis f. sp. tritici TaxID=56615 RepID=A0A5B0P9R6_PUCGR|nr:hypothetical protein PGT21_004959 [Puccinia graminis f. sp. tritici]KAA1134259.1 hypothetical protein PGTUg99_034082 [Puccinia graminis f. sp. tritici]
MQPWVSSNAIIIITVLNSITTVILRIVNHSQYGDRFIFISSGTFYQDFCGGAVACIMSAALFGTLYPQQFLQVSLAVSFWFISSHSNICKPANVNP